MAIVFTATLRLNTMSDIALLIGMAESIAISTMAVSLRGTVSHCRSLIWTPILIIAICVGIEPDC